MKKYIYLIVIIIFSSLFVSNSAQPGVWNAGGSGTFTLLYPEDSIAYKKIQMKSETIFMQLHKGFATVKGIYNFNNTSLDTLKIKVGYPINNVFENIKYNENVNEVRVDGLYKIKGIVNNIELPILKKPNSENDNWYVWEIAFPPKKITTFTVYFLVNTNNAKITQGYNSDKKNAFIYLIETGSIWKSPIEKGDFYTQLKEDISLQNLKASSPIPLFFDKENKTLKFSLSDYGKTPDPNFVVTYGKTLEDFNFKNIVKNSSAYFLDIDNFSNQPFNTFSFNKIDLPNPYNVNGNSNNVINFLFYFITYGIPLLLLFITIIILRLLYLKFKKKK